MPLQIRCVPQVMSGLCRVLTQVRPDQFQRGPRRVRVLQAMLRCQIRSVWKGYLRRKASSAYISLDIE